VLRTPLMLPSIETEVSPLSAVVGAKPNEDPGCPQRGSLNDEVSSYQAEVEWWVSRSRVHLAEPRYRRSRCRLPFSFSGLQPRLLLVGFV